MTAKKKRKPKAKVAPRNPYVLPMQSKKGGPMRDKKDKRAKENKTKDYTEEKNQ